MKICKKVLSLFTVLVLICMTLVFPCADISAQGENVTIQATYLGVADYGKAGTDIAHADQLTYVFAVGQTQKRYALAGDRDFVLQNSLIHGKKYMVTIAGNTVTAVRPMEGQLVLDPAYLPSAGTPGEKTVKNLLKTALMPVGSTLYMYGGGWNWQDTGAGTQTRMIGVPAEWWQFYRTHAYDYTYRTGTADSFYPYGGFNEYYYAGLDCSGYLGWTLYNTFETTNGKNGYVTKSTAFAESLAARGWGTLSRNMYAENGSMPDLAPGDVVSMKGHVWLSLGTCKDGSVLLAHSIPSVSRSGKKGGGVQLSAIGTGANCEAYRLADSFMRSYCPAWYQYYAPQLISPSAYLTASATQGGRFRWNISGANGGLTDPDGISGMTPGQVLEAVIRKD